MEIICVDKQTFEELRVRFCDFEERMTRVCRPAEDLGLKNWLDNQAMCFASTRRHYRYIATKGYCLSAVSRTSCSTSLKTYRDCWI